MNIRKPTDYVTMFTTLDTLMAADSHWITIHRISLYSTDLRMAQQVYTKDTGSQIPDY